MGYRDFAAPRLAHSTVNLSREDGEGSQHSRAAHLEILRGSDVFAAQDDGLSDHARDLLCNADLAVQLARAPDIRQHPSMRHVNVHEAKTSLSRLLEEVESGEKVVITRAGKPIAVILPYQAAVRKRRLGLFPGEAKMHADFDELPGDIAAGFGGAQALSRR